MKSVVVSLSGGMDSSTLLLRALFEYDNVIAVSFDYGQKHRVELERAQSLVNYINETCPTNENCFKATKLYQDLADSLGLTITEMAIAFVNHQEFVTSTIIGATTIDQLEENINAFDVLLTDSVFEEINKIQELIPNPAP